MEVYRNERTTCGCREGGREGGTEEGGTEGRRREGGFRYVLLYSF